MIQFKLTKMTQSNCAFNHPTQGLLQLDPPQINAERLSNGTFNKDNKREERTGTVSRRNRNKQAERQRQKKKDAQFCK